MKHHKCSFLMKTVELLRHTIFTEGLRLSSKKVEATMAAPALTDVPQLRSYLRLMNFYSKLLSNHVSVLAPLYKLLTKEVEWQWETQ